MLAQPLAARIVVVDADAGRARLCADVISTHATGAWAEGFGTDELAGALVEAADGAVCVCEDGRLPLEIVRHLRARLGASARAALVVVVPADRPGLAEEALRAGATDVLLRSPGYLEQLPVVVRAALIRAAAIASRATLEDSWRDQIRQLSSELAETRALADRLEGIAQTDALTGLGNRRAMDARLGEQFSAACRHDLDLSVLQIDLDALKSVNDGLGHAAGDELLKCAADAIRATLRRSDFAARVGGDEFVVVLPHTDAARAKLVADRIIAAFAGASSRVREELETHRRRTGVIHVLGGRSGARRESELGLSAGVASRRASGASNAAGLLAYADQALYAAKHQQPGTCRVFQPVMVVGEAAAKAA